MTPERGRGWALALIVVGSACSGTKTQHSAVDSGPPAYVAPDGLVLSFDGWTYVPFADDPFAGDAPVDCPAVAYKAENGFFELETDYCAAGTFEQATQSDVVAGASLVFVTWHLDLWAPEPATANLALRLGTDDVWTAEYAIPGNEQVEEVVVQAPRDLAAGTTAYFHLSNHGVNSWRMGDVARQNAD